MKLMSDIDRKRLIAIHLINGRMIFLDLVYKQSHVELLHTQHQDLYMKIQSELLHILYKNCTNRFNQNCCTYCTKIVKVDSIRIASYIGQELYKQIQSELLNIYCTRIVQQIQLKLLHILHKNCNTWKPLLCCFLGGERKRGNRKGATETNWTSARNDNELKPKLKINTHQSMQQDTKLHTEFHVAGSFFKCEKEVNQQRKSLYWTRAQVFSLWYKQSL